MLTIYLVALTGILYLVGLSKGSFPTISYIFGVALGIFTCIRWLLKKKESLNEECE